MAPWRICTTMGHIRHAAGCRGRPRPRPLSPTSSSPSPWPSRVPPRTPCARPRGRPPAPGPTAGRGRARGARCAAAAAALPDEQLVLGEADPRVRDGRLQLHGVLERGLGRGGLLRGRLDLAQREQRVDGQRVDVAGLDGERAGALDVAGGQRGERVVGAVDGLLRLRGRPRGDDRQRDDGDGRGDARAAAGDAPRAARATGRDPRASRRTAAPGTTVPGMNHVQSTSECTPKTTTTQPSASSPTRSASPPREPGPRHGPVARTADASQAASSASVSASPTMPRSAAVCTRWPWACSTSRSSSRNRRRAVA